MPTASNARAEQLLKASAGLRKAFAAPLAVADQEVPDHGPGLFLFPVDELFPGPAVSGFMQVNSVQGQFVRE